MKGRLRETSYASCQGDSAVQLWAIEDGDHSWPGDIFPGPDGKPRSAADEIVAFFGGFARAGVTMISDPRGISGHSIERRSAIKLEAAIIAYCGFRTEPATAESGAR